MRAGSIVCVDDDPDVLSSVARILRPLDHEVLVTIEPRQALDWIALRDVAVLVADYDMPLMNGIELSSSARAIRPETVRVLLTGARSLQTAIDGINRGEVFRYVAKPFEAPVLRDTLRAALARHHELALAADLRDQAVRRDLVIAALEAEHPGLTQVIREEDGAYRVPASASQAAAALGLDALLALGRR